MAALAEAGSDHDQLFHSGYFDSIEWAHIEAALSHVASVTNASELWNCLAEVSRDPRFVDAGDDYEPVLDRIQVGSDGDDFSAPCAAMPDVFETIVPRIAALVRQAPSLFGPGSAALALLPAGHEGKVSVSRGQVASLLAMAFLGIGLPLTAYARSTSPIPGETGRFPFPSMTGLVWPKRRCDFPPNVHKVRCFLSYFRHFCELDQVLATDNGAITVQRVVASKDDCARASHFAESSTPLCALNVLPLGASIEDQRGCVRVDFANSQVGGGVFLNTPGSTAQEEITFVTHPELCVAKFICEQVGTDEALVLSGARHIAVHRGYLGSFSYTGPAEGAMTDAAWLAIDALRLPDEVAPTQFLGAGTARESLKALAGFRGAVHATGMNVVATGAWGCGAFNGDPEVKALVQWAAASEAGVSTLLYHCWDDGATAAALARLATLGNTSNVRQLWNSATAVASRATMEAEAPSLVAGRGNFLEAVLAEANKSK